MLIEVGWDLTELWPRVRGLTFGQSCGSTLGLAVPNVRPIITSSCPLPKLTTVFNSSLLNNLFSKFHKNQPIIFRVILLTDRQTWRSKHSAHQHPWQSEVHVKICKFFLKMKITKFPVRYTVDSNASWRRMPQLDSCVARLECYEIRWGKPVRDCGPTVRGSVYPFRSCSSHKGPVELR